MDFIRASHRHPTAAFKTSYRRLFNLEAGFRV